MSELVIQASFNSGEWSPNLHSRVDVAKYKSGSALMRNWFPDYRGGASTRMGTKWIGMGWGIVYGLNEQIRMVRYQLSSTVGFALEFGQQYIRFYYQGAPVLEGGIGITATYQSNTLIIVAPNCGYRKDDIVFISGVAGMSQINNRYYRIISATGYGQLSLGDVMGNWVDATGFPAYGGGGTIQRVYQIFTFYQSWELSQLKFAQNANELIICHPNHPPNSLSEVTPTNWTLVPIIFGSVVQGPPIITYQTSLTSAGSTNYAYQLTAIDQGGDESGPGPVFNIGPIQDMRVTNGTTELQWYVTPNAIAYNVYKSMVSYTGVVPVGVQFGYIGQTTSTSFVDQNIAPDMTITPPVQKNPFSGSGVQSVTMTGWGTYTYCPAVDAIGDCSIPASLGAVLQVTSYTIAAGGSGYAVGDLVIFTNGLQLQVTGVGGGGAVTAFSSQWSAPAAPGSVTGFFAPANPMNQLSTSGSGSGAAVNSTWGVTEVIVYSPGVGYTTTPSIVFIPPSATANANMGATGTYPTVPSFFQQRSVYAAPPASPATFFMSRTGNYTDFDISVPVQADDAVTGTLVSGTLNSIKSIVSATSGMIILTDFATWIVNGGTSGIAVTPSSVVANAQSYVGANDMPPIVANYDVLYVQEKGAQVRDLAYNIYFNVFTGTEISILSNHLFYGYQLVEWAWAEEPFKMVWAVRNDGSMLTLSFLKEQDIVGWSQHNTNGIFRSVCTVTELSNGVYVDAIYMAVERYINGQWVQQIERMADRVFPTLSDCWCVDSAIEYNGAPAQTFYGASHLGGMWVSGLADGNVIPSFVMPGSGTFTLSAPASKVIIGLPYNCDLQTLPIDVGSPTIQGKLKKIPHVDMLLNQTMGLQIGSSFNTLVNMKDLVNGAVSSGLTGQSVQTVNGLYYGHARTFLDNTYTVPGQYCIRQTLPYPATVVGVFPALEVGDDK